ncbi:MAG: hypothetical protein PHF35_01670 [Candidatus Moranbacteria bacterium]|nr:hypothetical protein [Candidatus Moranbacteria bacterium]
MAIEKEAQVLEKTDWADPKLEGKVFTKNGFRVADLTPYDPDNIMERAAYEGLKVFCGNISDAAYPYGIWDQDGKTRYVHNFQKKENLSDFDLVLKG